jgi:peptidyl-prolyl cis-trans isomerase B (cyclophilin B)
MPPGYSPYGYAPQPGTNGLAIASLICAFLCTPLGVIFGVIAKSQIKRTGQSGNGLATAGIIISVASFVLAIILFIVAGTSHPSNP